ncbi:hypothetical protein LTR56_027370 [Elasticomyces elasticus]|nr:hypothetical protein LTR56_027370 [Elasticomyces elasticus]KAK3615880.1 hypothetical protein LTR22_027259 [Elasticomyces elasticus]
MISLPVRTREQSFSNRDSRIVNQAGQQTIHGGQHIHFEAARSNPRGCVSVPFTTFTTYTERSGLSAQLEEKLCQPCRGKKLAHAVTVTGLGGTGKTQLVLNEQTQGDLMLSAVVIGFGSLSQVFNMDETALVLPELQGRTQMRQKNVLGNHMQKWC